jgi:hypothetical protein
MMNGDPIISSLLTAPGGPSTWRPAANSTSWAMTAKRSTGFGISHRRSGSARMPCRRNLFANLLRIGIVRVVASFNQFGHRSGCVTNDSANQ